MIGLLIAVLVILVIAWICTLIVGTLPGVPPFAPTVIWVAALLFILVELLKTFGGTLGLPR